MRARSSLASAARRRGGWAASASAGEIARVPRSGDGADGASKSAVSSCGAAHAATAGRRPGRRPRGESCFCHCRFHGVPEHTGKGCVARGHLSVPAPVAPAADCAPGSVVHLFPARIGRGGRSRRRRCGALRASLGGGRAAAALRARRSPALGERLRGVLRDPARRTGGGRRDGAGPARAGRAARRRGRLAWARGLVATLSTSSSDSSPSASLTRSGLTSATSRPLIVSPACTRRDLLPATSRRNAVFLPSTSGRARQRELAALHRGRRRLGGERPAPGGGSD